MIEEIKKEINEKVNDYFWKQGCKNEEVFIKIKKIYNGVLNKYKDKEDKYLTERVDTLKKTQLKQLKMISYLENYKNAWEELKKISQNDDCGEKTAHDFLWFLEQTMQELEKKHGIEVE